MRILFLTQVLPYPLDAGPKMRAYFVIRHLAQRHEVTLLSFVRGNDREENIEHLRQLCRGGVYTVPMRRSRARDALYLMESFATARPFLVIRDGVPEMWGEINRLLAKTRFDVVHADQLSMAQYALWARSRTSGHDSRAPKLVLDQHNAVYAIPERMAASVSNPFMRAFLRLESRKVARYEVTTCCRFDRVVWVTQQDYEAVRRRLPDPTSCQLDSTVIPICVAPRETPVIARQEGARRVTFVGGLHYPPNAQGLLWFAEQVFPQVLAQAPDAVLTVIGNRPPKEVLALQSRCSNVQVTGYVEEIAPYLAETAVFIVPLLAGGGMRVKILDAWMWGVPIVSTTIGAEGIEIRPRENILIADTPGDFAQATVHLLQNLDAGRRMAEAGRRWVESHYDWRQVYRMWDSVYAGLDRK